MYLALLLVLAKARKRVSETDVNAVSHAEKNPENKMRMPKHTHSAICTDVVKLEFIFTSDNANKFELNKLVKGSGSI